MKQEVEVVYSPEQGPRQRIDRFLAQLGRWGSRARVQKLIQEGYVRMNGQPARCGQVLRPGQRIEVLPHPGEQLDLRPEPIPLNILFEDPFLLVIDKPAGLVVHPAPSHGRGTLVHALLHHWQGHPEGLDPLRPGIVHRLDKETSGVLVIAKTADILAALARQFQERTVQKEYWAAVWGRPRHARGSVDAPIGRDPVHRKRMSIRRDGRPAYTEWEVVRASERVSWLRVWPRTGRTHQIRVHLSSIGHPLVGDPLYSRPRRAADVPVPNRLALHARRIAFVHPASGQSLEFEAPLAPDLEALWCSCAPVEDSAEPLVLRHTVRRR